MQWIQLAAMVQKEFRQTLRDRRMMFLLVAIPFVELIAFGFAVNLDIRNIRTVVVDDDRTEYSRSQVQRLMTDPTLRKVGSTTSVPEAEKRLISGDVQAVLIVPDDFTKNVARGRQAHVQALIDGSDPNRSLVASSTITEVFNHEATLIAARRSSAQARASGVAPQTPSFELVPKLLYNPALNTPIYIIPGIAAILLMLVTTLIAALGLARERETGTLEQILVTPIHPITVVLGKVIPFGLIGLFDFVLALVVGAWIFDMPLRGDLFSATWITVLYLIACLGVGVVISNVSKTQQAALLAGFLFLLPAALLSGILSPIIAMPEWLQIITWANPLRHYAELLRAILLKGASPLELWPDLLALALFGAFSVVVAVRGFRKTVG